MPPSTSRSSMAEPSTAPVASRRGPDLPTYQPMTKPLTARARRQMATLLTQHSLSTVKQRVEESMTIMQEFVETMNDNIRDNNIVYEKSLAKFRNLSEKNGTVDEAEEKRLNKMNEDLQTLRPKVDKLLQQLDENARKMIDDKRNLGFLEDSVREAKDTIERSAGAEQQTQAQTQTQTQAQTQTHGGTQNGENASAQGDTTQASLQDFTPTEPTSGPTQSSSTQPPLAPTTLFKAALERKRDRYQSQSLYERYAKDNDYKRFKQSVHNSSYEAGEAPPLPPERTWFEEGTLPQPGTAARGAAADDDSEDDLAVSREKISTKCPLTLQEFRDPVTSTKCPHSFEKEAMMEMIEGPQNCARVGGGRSGQKVVQCPVPGCSAMLTKNDVIEDMALKRMIARLQRAARRAEEDAASDEEGGPEAIPSDDEYGREIGDDEDEEHDMRITQLKKERASIRPSR